MERQSLRTKEGFPMYVEPVYMGHGADNGYHVVIMEPNAVTVRSIRTTYATREQAQADAVLVHLHGEAGDDDEPAPNHESDMHDIDVSALPRRLQNLAPWA